MAMDAPSRASSVAMARPNPPVAPVTRATSPANRMDLSPYTFRRSAPRQPAGHSTGPVAPPAGRNLGGCLDGRRHRQSAGTRHGGEQPDHGSRVLSLPGLKYHHGCTAAPPPANTGPAG